jgi:hypothetical protein
MVSALDLLPDGQLQGPARRAALLVGSFGLWTLLVWFGRIRNIVADDELSGAGQAWRLLLAALFVGGAVDVLVRFWQSRGRIRVRPTRDGGGRVEVPRLLLRSVSLLAVFTTVVWVIRGLTILFDDYDAGFKLVHTLLAVASIALGVLAWWAIAPRSPGAARSR